jgi:hypothetical protein
MRLDMACVESGTKLRRMGGEVGIRIKHPEALTMIPQSNEVALTATTVRIGRNYRPGGIVSGILTIIPVMAMA